MIFVLSALLALSGMGCFALSQERHWKGLPAGLGRRARPAVWLRGVGGSLLAASLSLCLLEGGTDIAVLVWLMEISFSTVLMAAALARRA